MGAIDPFRLLKHHTCPIGVDIGDDNLKLAQLEKGKKGISLIAWNSKDRPAGLITGSSDWQKWALETIRELTAGSNFRGKEAIAAIPSSEVFIDHIKMAGTKDDKLEDAILPKIKQKLPVDPEKAMIKYIPTEEDNVLVIAVEQKKIERHLAIYEKTNLRVKSISIWPLALINSYTGFFCRRKTDINSVVMLLDIETGCTNIVICRHKNLLFARSIPIGAKQMESDKMVTKLVLELTACRRHFCSMHKKAPIERLIFLSGLPAGNIDRDIRKTIAKELEMPAQIGDCLAAVEIANSAGSGLDRRGCKTNWATAFGISLSEE